MDDKIKQGEPLFGRPKNGSPRTPFRESRFGRGFLCSCVHAEQGPPRPLYPAARGTVADKRQAGNKRSPPDAFGKIASSWAGEQTERAGEKLAFPRPFLSVHGALCAPQAGFAGRPGATPADTPRWVQGPMDPGSGFGGEEPPTSPLRSSLHSATPPASPQAPNVPLPPFARSVKKASFVLWDWIKYGILKRKYFLIEGCLCANRFCCWYWE